jgi:hypothetical protein
MAESLRTLLTSTAIFVLILAAWVVAEVLHRRGKVAAACRQAQPLVDRRASRSDALTELGQPWGDRGAADLPELERLFASPPQEADSLRRHLHGPNRVLIYTTNDYIMFVHFDGTDRAAEAECFHQ